MTEHEELLGADYMEHNIHHPGVGVTRAVSVLKDHKENVDLQLVPVGKNKGILNLTESYSKTGCKKKYHILYFYFDLRILILGHMDYLERKYVNKKEIGLRLRDMVRVSPLEEEDSGNPESTGLDRY